MDGLVHQLGSQVVQQHDRCPLPCEVVLEGEYLPPVAQRALRQQAYLRKAVQHHPCRADLLEHLEDLLGGLAEFQVVRMKQALLLLGAQQAFGRHQFEDSDVVAQHPSVRTRPFPQLLFGLRQRQVQASFIRIGEKETEADGCLACAGTALQQEGMTTGKPAAEDFVETGYPGRGLRWIRRMTHSPPPFLHASNVAGAASVCGCEETFTGRSGILRRPMHCSTSHSTVVYAACGT